MEITHEELVRKLVKDGELIRSQLTAEQANIWHLSYALSGEVGEIIDAFKKWIVYRKELDRVNILEELGDIEFYLEGIRQALNITREETLKDNIKKLSNRYKTLSYTDKAAQDKADKQ